MRVADTCPDWLNEFNEWLYTQDNVDDADMLSPSFANGWLDARKGLTLEHGREANGNHLRGEQEGVAYDAGFSSFFGACK